MPSELITVIGKTDGTNTSGDVIFTSIAFTNSTNIIKFDKGLKVKIWAKRIAGKPVKFTIKFIPNTGVSPVPEELLGYEELVSEGVIELEKRRPIVINCRTGKEGLKVSWVQDQAGESYIVFDLEIEPLP